jgi:hypothetical protein
MPISIGIAKLRQNGDNRVFEINSHSERYTSDKDQVTTHQYIREMQTKMGICDNRIQSHLLMRTTFERILSSVQ